MVRVKGPSFQHSINALTSIVSYHGQNNQKVRDTAQGLKVTLLECWLADERQMLPLDQRLALVGDLTPSEQDDARHDRKIAAIKSVRQRTGIGLKEAKDLVEAWMQKNLGFTHFPSNKW